MDGAEAGKRAEAAIGAGDHPLAPDDPSVPLDPLRHRLRVLDVVGAGVDNARNQNLIGRQRYRFKNGPLVLVARIGSFNREPAGVYLVDDVQDVGQRHVLVVRAGVIAPADVDANALGIKTLQRMVERLDVKLDLGPKLGDRCVGKL